MVGNDDPLQPRRGRQLQQVLPEGSSQQSAFDRGGDQSIALADHHIGNRAFGHFAALPFTIENQFRLYFRDPHNIAITMF